MTISEVTNNGIAAKDKFITLIIIRPSPSKLSQGYDPLSGPRGQTKVEKI